MIFDRKQQLNWYNHPFDICLNQERLVGWIRVGVGGVRVGVSCVKYLKRGWNRKEGGSKDFKKRGQARSRCRCLKKGSWNPLTNYKPIWLYCIICTCPYCIICKGVTASLFKVPTSLRNFPSFFKTFCFPTPSSYFITF